MSTRTLTFPDGIERPVQTWRVVWRWYDHLLAYEFCPPEDVILKDVLDQSSTEAMTAGETLASVVQAYVDFIETSGGDVTDDDIETVIARKAAILKTKRECQSRRKG